MSLQDKLNAAATNFGQGEFQEAYDDYVLALAEVRGSRSIGALVSVGVVVACARRMAMRACTPSLPLEACSHADAPTTSQRFILNVFCAALTFVHLTGGLR